MFSMCCGDCGARWEIGTKSTCTCPDEASESKWVGLTPEQIDEIIQDAIDPMDALIQTMDKLKELNT